MPSRINPNPALFAVRAGLKVCAPFKAGKIYHARVALRPAGNHPSGTLIIPIDGQWHEASRHLFTPCNPERFHLFPVMMSRTLKHAA